MTTRSNCPRRRLLIVTSDMAAASRKFWAPLSSPASHVFLHEGESELRLQSADVSPTAHEAIQTFAWLVLAETSHGTDPSSRARYSEKRHRCMVPASPRQSQGKNQCYKSGHGPTRLLTMRLASLIKHSTVRLSSSG